MLAEWKSALGHSCASGNPGLFPTKRNPENTTSPPSLDSRLRGNATGPPSPGGALGTPASPAMGRSELFHSAKMLQILFRWCLFPTEKGLLVVFASLKGWI